MDLALFDFDGTITSAPTYPAFVRFAVSRRRQVLGSVVLAPTLSAYHLGFLSDRSVRTAISRVAFWKDEPGRLRTAGARYAREVLPQWVRPEALERIEWHRARGDRVVVVSAALDVYLRPWCEMQHIEAICTELEVHSGRCTGGYAAGDCCGAEKSRRVRDRLRLTDYDVIYAYGDTEEDREMLQLASRRFYRWEEVREMPGTSSATARGDYARRGG